MRLIKKVLTPAVALALLAAVACGTARDFTGQRVPGVTAPHEPRQAVVAEQRATPAAVASRAPGFDEIPVSTPAGKSPAGVGAEPFVPPPGSIEVSIYPAGRVLTDPEAAPRTVLLTPTYAWVNAYSLSTTVRGEPVPRGSVIIARDPEGVVIGRSTVDRDGRFGVMALYMDDPATPVDEGALPGDVLTFLIDGEPAVAVGPDAPVWTANGAVLSLDLVVGGPAH